MEQNEWTIDASEIELTPTVLGIGQHSTIYLGKWRLIDVAVKKFNTDTCHPCNRRFLMKELGILFKMHHPHIVQVLGVCWDPFMLVLEYLSGGNVRDRVLNTKWDTLHWFYQRKKWSLELCLGVIYMHERKPELVIHRDIKPSNLLLDKHLSIKIADFGISKLLQATTASANVSHNTGLDRLDNQQMTHNIGTPFYAAPEIFLKDDGLYTVHSDVWSFGCTLLEIWEGIFISTMYSESEWYQQKQGESIVFHSTPRSLRPVIRQCLSNDPLSRPALRDIIPYIEKLKMWCMLFH